MVSQVLANGVADPGAFRAIVLAPRQPQADCRFARKKDLSRRRRHRRVNGDPVGRSGRRRRNRGVAFSYQSVFLVSIDGGSPTQVSNLFAGVTTLDVSPDSKSLLFKSVSGENRIFVACDLPTCASRRNLTSPPESGLGRIRWTPDGRGFAYRDVAGSNLWVQPLDGGPPHQLTHFTDGRTIDDFAWSRDGSVLPSPDRRRRTILCSSKD